jgi:outer membrane protein assembly factor BamB
LKIVWAKPLNSRGLAGIAATERYVIVADRTAVDSGDLFRCLDAATGDEIWQLTYPTTGTTKDYGNVPRATPLVLGGNVVTLGCLGDLKCVELASGKVRWSKNFVRDFGARVPTWGYCASPLAVDGKLIVNPGAKLAAVVALDCGTGKEVWRCPGLPPAYASFIAGTFGGARQIIGYDEKSLGGWDPASGKRLWTLVPPMTGDFNVPSPIDAGGRLIVASENNGTRIYDFAAAGRIKTTPEGSNGDLAPDMSTPVLVGRKLFGCSGSLYCLDVSKRLATRWNGEDDALAGYASVIAAEDRVLVATNHGELLLVDGEADRFSIVSRLRVFAEDSEMLSHPAIVGTRLYLRDMTRIVCVDLNGK